MYTVGTSRVNFFSAISAHQIKIMSVKRSWIKFVMKSLSKLLYSRTIRLRNFKSDITFEWNSAIDKTSFRTLSHSQAIEYVLGYCDVREAECFRRIIILQVQTCTFTISIALGLHNAFLRRYRNSLTLCLVKGKWNSEKKYKYSKGKK